MKFGARIMEKTWAYRLWQAPFTEQKFAPILAHNNLQGVRRVLDVGCGPGTSSRYFAGTDYLGIDINPEYIEYARRRCPGNFVVADATTFTAPAGAQFDFILVNSFLHHMDTPKVHRMVSRLATLLTRDGHVHILDLVLPKRPSLARLLARLDRGEFARPLGEWQEIFGNTFQPVIFEPYPVAHAGVVLLNMVYFKGRRKDE